MNRMEQFAKVAQLVDRVESVLSTASVQERSSVLALMHVNILTDTTASWAEDLKDLRHAIASLVRESPKPTPQPLCAPAPQPSFLQAAYLTERQVAQFLNVSLALLRRWRLQRQGPKFCKVGRLVRYRREDIDAFSRGL